MDETITDYRLERGKAGWNIVGYDGAETHLVIPSHVDDVPVVLIAKEAFQDNRNLVSVEVPKTVTFIGNFAFASCSSLERVDLKAHVSALNLNTFWDCAALQDVNLPDGLTKIGDGAFRDCPSLRTLDVPDSVTEIGDSAFRDSKALHTMLLGRAVTTIQRNAFRDCTSLSNVAVSDALSYIGPRAFQGCTALRSITIVGNNLDATLAAFKNHSLAYLVSDYAIREHLYTFSEGKRLFNSKYAHEQAFAARIIASYPDQLASFFAKRRLAKTLSENGYLDDMRTLSKQPGFFDEALIRECIDVANDAGKAETVAFLLDLLPKDNPPQSTHAFDSLKL